MKKIILSLLSVLFITFTFCCCESKTDTNSNKKEKSNTYGATSKEKAIENYLECYNNGDPISMLHLAFPKEVCKTVCDMTGYNEEKFAYSYIGAEGLFKTYKNIYENSPLKYGKIIKENEFDYDDYAYMNKALHETNIEEDIDYLDYVEFTIKENSYEIDDDDISEVWIYSINDRWYIGMEYYVEDVFDMLYDGEVGKLKVPEEYKELTLEEYKMNNYVIMADGGAATFSKAIFSAINDLKQENITIQPGDYDLFKLKEQDPDFYNHICEYVDDFSMLEQVLVRIEGDESNVDVIKVIVKQNGIYGSYPSIGEGTNRDNITFDMLPS